MGESVGARTIRLRYAGKCSGCGTELQAGTEAHWDRATRSITCLRCLDGASSAPPEPPASAAPGLVESRQPAPRPTLSPSDAGGSAQAEYERRHRKREERLDARWGRFAGVAKFLSDDPQSTKAWARGAQGERRLAAHLTRVLGDRAVFLHDRKHGRANIDHLVVASSGVWVIDAKNYEGRVEHRNVGGWFGPADNRIFVGGRDKTKLAAGLGWQVEAVRSALGELDVPVQPVLCFTSSDWGLFAKPFRHDGVLVTWASKLAELIAEPGPLGPEDVEIVAQRLGQRLKPAA